MKDYISRDVMLDVVELESASVSCIVGLSIYFYLGKDRLTRLVREHEARKLKYSLKKEASKILKECVNQENDNEENIMLELKHNIEKR